MKRALWIGLVLSSLLATSLSRGFGLQDQEEQAQLERNRRRWEELDEDQRAELRRRHARLQRLVQTERHRLEIRQQYFEELRSRVIEQLEPAEKERLRRLPRREQQRVWRRIVEPKLAEIESEVAQWLPETEWETLKSLPEEERARRLEDFLVEEIRRTLVSLEPGRPLPTPEAWRRDPDRHMRRFLEERKRAFLADPPRFFLEDLDEEDRARLRRAAGDRFFAFLRRRFADQMQFDFPLPGETDRPPFALTPRQLERIESLPEGQREAARQRQSDLNFRRFLERHGVSPDRLRALMQRPVEERAAIAQRLAGSPGIVRDALPPLVARLGHLTVEQRRELESVPPERRRRMARRLSRENLLRALVDRFQLDEDVARRWVDLKPVDLERRLRRRLAELGEDRGDK